MNHDVIRPAADGLGRRSTTLNAVTSCTTIMLVSALGKDAYCEDEIYGRLFAVRCPSPTFTLQARGGVGWGKCIGGIVY